jgi:uncharacterized protein
MLGIRRLAVMVLVCVLASLAPRAHAAAPRGIEGPWQGSIMGALRLQLRIERASDGSLRATLESPDQGSAGMKLDVISFADDSLHAVLAISNARYDARLNAAGDSLHGVWSQGGMTLPLWMARGELPARRRPQDPAPPYPYDTLEVSFANAHVKAVRLAGTLTLPKGKGPFPAALLISGSGLQDRDETISGHHPFRVLADHLTRGGIAVLRVDDRGRGGSTGPVHNVTSEDLATDVLAGVEFLAKRRDIDRRRLGLVGHSEGALIAPIVANLTTDVAYIVMLAGPGVRGDSLMLLQMAATRRSIGISQAFVDREVAIARRVWAAVRSVDSVECVAAMRELVEAQRSALPDAQRDLGGTLDEQVRTAMAGIWNPWMQNFAGYDPVPTMRRLRCPVLAVNGDRDVQVLASENLAGIEDALSGGGNRDFTVRSLPGLNHLFQTCGTCSIAEYGLLDETIAPAALELVTNWIRKRTGLEER